eukprot:117681-Chlamydomonas_euryale.AAC.1
MSGKSRFSCSSERDNLRHLRDSVIRDKVWAESDAPHVPGECSLPAHVEPSESGTNYGFKSGTIETAARDVPPGSQSRGTPNLPARCGDPWDIPNPARDITLSRKRRAVAQ